MQERCPEDVVSGPRGKRFSRGSFGRLEDKKEPEDVRTGGQCDRSSRTPALGLEWLYTSVPEADPCRPSGADDVMLRIHALGRSDRLDNGNGHDVR